MKEILVGKIHGYLSVSHASLLDVSAGYCHRPLVGESGMIRYQMEKQ
jgi:hypothetical protein